MSRGRKRSESHQTVSKQTYRLFDGHLDVLEKFLEKRKEICILVGQSDAVNLLHPGKFLCPIDGCRALVNLKFTNNYEFIHRHLEAHKSEKGSELLIDRLKYIESSEWVRENKYADTTTLIDHVNNVNNLQIENVTFFCLPATGPRFKGKHFLMDVKIIEKLMDGDQIALDTLPSGIGAYFTPHN